MRTLQGSASAGAHGLPAPHWHALEQCSRERPEPAVAIIPRWKVRLPMSSKHHNNIDEFLLLRFFPSRAAVSFQSLRIRLCCEQSHFAVQFPLGALGLPEPSHVTDFVHGLETCIARTADRPTRPRHRHRPSQRRSHLTLHSFPWVGIQLRWHPHRPARVRPARAFGSPTPNGVRIVLICDHGTSTGS